MDVSELVTPEGVVLQPSKINKRMTGAWCITEVKKGTLFGPFKGEIVKENQRKRIDFRYAWEVYDLETNELSHIVSATDPSKGDWTRYVNCARYLEEQNLVSVQEGMEVYYKAIRDIPAGEELLTWFERSKIKENKVIEKSPEKQGKDKSPDKQGKDKSPEKQGKDKSPDKQGKEKSPVKQGKDKSPIKQGKDVSPKKKGKRTKSDSSLGLGSDEAIGEKRQRKKKKLYGDEEVSFSKLIPKKRARKMSDPTMLSIDTVCKESTADSGANIDKVSTDTCMSGKIAKKRGPKKGWKKEKGEKGSLKKEAGEKVKSSGPMKEKLSKEDEEKLAEIEKNWKFPPRHNEYQFEVQAIFGFVVNNKRMYKCDICTCTYRQTFSLKRHYLRSHINCSYINKGDMSNCMIAYPAQYLALLKNNSNSVMEKVTKRLKAPKQKLSNENLKNAETIVMQKENENSESASSSVTKKEDNTVGSSVFPALYRCSACNMLFDEKMELMSHTKNHPGEGNDNLHRCPSCSVTFRFKMNLVRHQQIHEKEKEELLVHKEKMIKKKKIKEEKLSKYSHSGDPEKPLGCSVCSKKFKHECHLVKHMRIHTDWRPCNFPGCGRSFVSAVHLKRHMLTHNGFKCKSCDHVVTNPGAYRKHIRLVHPEVHIERLRKLLAKRGKLSAKSMALLNEADRKQRLKDEREKIKRKEQEESKMVVEKSVDKKDKKKEEQIVVKKKRGRKPMSLLKNGKISAKGKSEDEEKGGCEDKREMAQSDSREEKMESENKTDDSASGMVETDQQTKKEKKSKKKFEDGIDSRFKFSCVICKKRFTEYLNMCRHRRVAHENPEKLKYECGLSNKNGEKVKNFETSEVVHESPEEVAAFYATVAYNIAENLNCYLDGGQDAVANCKSLIKTTDEEEAEEKDEGKEEIVWEQYNFPHNYDIRALSENFEYDPTDPDKEKQICKPKVNYFEIDENSLDDRSPAQCLRRRGSRESREDRHKRSSSLGYYSSRDDSSSRDADRDDSLSRDVGRDNPFSSSRDDSLSRDVDRDNTFSQDVDQDNSSSRDVDRDDSLSRNVNQDDSIIQEADGSSQDGGKSNHSFDEDVKLGQDGLSQDLIQGTGTRKDSHGSLIQGVDKSSKKDSSNRDVIQDEDSNGVNGDVSGFDVSSQEAKQINGVTQDLKQNGSAIQDSIEIGHDNCDADLEDGKSQGHELGCMRQEGGQTCDLNLNDTEYSNDVVGKADSISQNVDVDVDTGSMNKESENTNESEGVGKDRVTCVSNNNQVNNVEHVASGNIKLEENTSDNLSENKVNSFSESSSKIDGCDNKLILESDTFENEETFVEKEDMFNPAVEDDSSKCDNFEREESDVKNSSELNSLSEKDKSNDEKVIKTEDSNDDTCEGRKCIMGQKKEGVMGSQRECSNDSIGNDTEGVIKSKEVECSTVGKTAEEFVEIITIATVEDVKIKEEEAEEPVISVIVNNGQQCLQQNEENFDFVTNTCQTEETLGSVESSVDNPKIDSKKLSSGESGENVEENDDNEKLSTVTTEASNIKQSGSARSLEEGSCASEHSSYSSQGMERNDKQLRSLQDRDKGLDLQKTNFEFSVIKSSVQKKVVENSSIESSDNDILMIDLVTDSDSNSNLGSSVGKLSSNDPKSSTVLFNRLCLSKEKNTLEKAAMKEGNVPIQTNDNYEEIKFGSLGDPVYVCSVCKRHYPDFDGLMRHQWKKHPSINCHFMEVEQGLDIEDLYYSEPCSRGILGTTGKALENVMSKASYTCTRCKGSFKSPNRLRVHIVNCATPSPSPKKKKYYYYKRKTPTKQDGTEEESPSKKVNLKELNAKLKQLSDDMDQADKKKKIAGKNYLNEDLSKKSKVSEGLSKLKDKKESSGKESKSGIEEKKLPHNLLKTPEKKIEVGKMDVEKDKSSSPAKNKRKEKLFVFDNEFIMGEYTYGRRKKMANQMYNPRNHVRRRELTEVLDTHQCKGCGVKFKSLSLLERHVKKCDGKEKFKDLEVIKSHVNEVFHIKHKHGCMYCGRSFTYPKTLMNHLIGFCNVKKEKTKSGELTQTEIKQEAHIMTLLKQHEENQKFSEEMDQEENAIIPKKKGGWPKGTKRKMRRKNHAWTSIKRRKSGNGQGKIVSSSDQIEDNLIENKESKANYIIENEEITANDGIENEESTANDSIENKESTANCSKENEEIKANVGIENEESTANDSMENEESMANDGTRNEESMAKDDTRKEESMANDGIENKESTATDGIENEESVANDDIENKESTANNGIENVESVANDGIEKEESVANESMENEESTANDGIENEERTTNDCKENNKSLENDSIENEESLANFSKNTEKMSSHKEYELKPDASKIKERRLGKSKKLKSELKKDKADVKLDTEFVPFYLQSYSKKKSKSKKWNVEDFIPVSHMKSVPKSPSKLPTKTISSSFGKLCLGSDKSPSNCETKPSLSNNNASKSPIRSQTSPTLCAKFLLKKDTTLSTKSEAKLPSKCSSKSPIKGNTKSPLKEPSASLAKSAIKSPSKDDGSTIKGAKIDENSGNVSLVKRKIDCLEKDAGKNSEIDVNERKEQKVSKNNMEASDLNMDIHSATETGSGNQGSDLIIKSLDKETEKGNFKTSAGLDENVISVPLSNVGNHIATNSNFQEGISMKKSGQQIKVNEMKTKSHVIHNVNQALCSGGQSSVVQTTATTKKNFNLSASADQTSTSSTSAGADNSSKKLTFHMYDGSSFVRSKEKEMKLKSYDSKFHVLEEKDFAKKLVSKSSGKSARKLTELSPPKGEDLCAKNNESSSSNQVQSKQKPVKINKNQSREKVVKMSSVVKRKPDKFVFHSANFEKK